jgi:dCMP deaminase
VERSRPPWDEVWMDVAKTMATRSVCSRAQVGAVIVSSENRVLATGYNGPPANYALGFGYGVSNVLATPCDGSTQPERIFCIRGRFGPTPETIKSYEDCPTIHAEMNALIHSDRSKHEGGTLYVTGACCWTCAKAIANSGLARVVMLEEEVDRAYRSPENTLTLFDACGIAVGYVK